MRVLFLNSFEFPPNALADSSYTLTKRIIEHLPDDFFSIFLMPTRDLSGRRRYGFIGDPEEIERCEYIYTPLLSGRPESELLISDALWDLFNPMNGSRVDYDVVITNNSIVGQRLVDWFTSSKGQAVLPPVIVLDYCTPFIGSACDLGYLRDEPRKVLSHYVGFANADKTFFFTDYSKRKALQQAREWLSPALVKRFAARSEVLPIFFSYKKLDETVKDVPKRESVTVYWGGRLTATKRVAMALETADYLFSFGRDLRMVATIPGREPAIDKMLVGKQKHYPKQLETHFGLTQIEAWKIMASCQISIFPQSLRYGPAAPMEQIRAGLIVLINKADSVGVLPEEYPWFWSSPTELQALIRRVIANLPAEMAKQAYWREWVKEHRSIENNIERLITTIKELHVPVAQHFKKQQSKLITGRLTDHVANERWIEYINRLLKEHAVYGQLKYVNNPIMSNPSLWAVFQTFVAHGFVKETVSNPLIVS